MTAVIILAGSALTAGSVAAPTGGSNLQSAVERQLTTGPDQKGLDNNINFSPDGTRLVFDCRGSGGIVGNTRLGIADVRSGNVTIFYEQKPPLHGLGAPSFLNDREVIAIHALTTGVPYDITARGGRILPADGSSSGRWLDSRDVVPPFTPGALRGGTHKHEPDASGQWVGFTYNDSVVKAHHGSQVRNVGVSKRGRSVRVHADKRGRNFVGESFSVLLTACVAHARPGSDEYERAEGDCWVGREGYPKAGGHQRARAFRGEVIPTGGGKAVSDVFVVDVPTNLTIPGPLGPLQGTTTDFPKPPKGAVCRRLTHTASDPNPSLRGVSGQLRASPDGRWIAYTARARDKGRAERQIFVVSPVNGVIRQLSHLPGGVSDSLRFSPNGHFVAGASRDGGIVIWSTGSGSWGKTLRLTPPGADGPSNIVISPDSRLIAYNRDVDGVAQIFTVPSPETVP